MVGYLDNKLESDRVVQGATAPAPAAGGLLVWWRSEERILAQIEVLLVVYVLLIVLQVVVGRWRRCSSSAFIKYPLLLAYTATNPLATYTLGVMFNSSYKSNPLPLMSALLIYGLGGINSMTAYNIDDNKRYLDLFTQHVLVMATYLASMSMSNFVLMMVPYVPMISETVVARMMASSFSDDDSSKQLQWYMNIEHTPSGSYDPVTLRGYRYLVSVADRITVSDIWLSNQGPLGGGGGAQLKEVCLSCALFILLRRRFFGASFPEAKLQK